MPNMSALLIKYGEIALRGGNRKIYEDMLVEVIKKRAEAYGQARLRKDQGRFIVDWDTELSQGKLSEAAERIAGIFGLAGVCPCIRTTDSSVDNIKALVLAHMKERGVTGATFKIDATRADKSYPLTSQELSAEVGAFILEHMPELKVDVKNPQIRLRVEIRNQVYIYSESIKGLGGLPPGSGGKGVLLLSGGFDSPVAGYMTARRGVELICVYFHSPPYTSELAKGKAVDLAKRLSDFTGGIKLYVVSFTDIQLYLNEHSPENKLTIFLKRAMLQAAGDITARERACVLVTGDCIGQVASQTLQALEATDSAAAYPVLRPLCGMDKLDIIGIAQRIGTHDISARPYADCCTLFVAKHPEIKPKRSVIERMEQRMEGLKPLIAEAVATAEILVL